MDGVGRSAIEKRPRQRERAWRPGGSCAPGSPVEPWKPLLAWALAKLLPPAVEWLPCPVKPVPASEKIWLVSGGARASQQPTLGRAVNPAVSEHTGDSTIFLLQRPSIQAKLPRQGPGGCGKCRQVPSQLRHWACCGHCAQSLSYDDFRRTRPAFLSCGPVRARCTRTHPLSPSTAALGCAGPSQATRPQSLTRPAEIRRSRPGRHGRIDGSRYA